MHHSSGVRMSKIKTLAGIVSPEALSLAWRWPHFHGALPGLPSVPIPEVCVFKFPLLMRTPDEIRAQTKGLHF